VAGRLGGPVGGLLNRSLDEIIQQQRKEGHGKGGSGSGGGSGASKSGKREAHEPGAKSRKKNRH
jgi:hypothetical protein